MLYFYEFYDDGFWSPIVTMWISPAHMRVMAEENNYTYVRCYECGKRTCKGKFVYEKELYL